ncbi:MAG: T9SS type A sorting domain-containing protein [Sphingobacteriales bacterium]|jgi:hypothetical protein|nr:T9SS type A sorting domain-containing protein [Sphingobacteriales bacterium]MBP9140603.1 T9SS type A sorting domain-containing protein [Chitinophagales bacterium]MDA0197393.1 T9SS type A sorting domain-containing protein [Bacteroidota bacterium]MBK6888657.1 T9SS type A sorting domain-containing protein [Sphingobacteriales bacterium]MBK7528834.1 T9SS type A sorting domain-containing protein [Sphingobacteriales bacterium]
MKKIILFVLAFTAIATTFYAGQLMVKKTNQSVAEKEREHGEEEKEGGRVMSAKYFYAIKANQITGKIDLADVYKAEKQADKLQQTAPAKEIDMTWDFIGPNNVGGRSRTVVIDRNNPKSMILGSVSGGLWTSTDGGLNWAEHPQNPDLPSKAISYGVQATNGYIYFGTGEGFYYYFGFGAGGTPGRGVIVSKDGGKTFELLASTDPGATPNINFGWASVNKLAAHPTKNIIYAAIGNNEAAGSGSGLFYSDDDGQTWKVPNGINNNDKIGWDVVVAANGTVYAAIGNRYFRANDGENFELLNSPDNLPGDFLATGGRKRMAVAPSNNNIIYSIFINANSSCLQGVYRSEDGGKLWVEIGAGGGDFFDPFDNSVQCQGSYDLAFAVDPANPNRIFVGGITLWTWTDGDGWLQVDNTFDSPQNNKYVHADKHDIVFHPTDPNQMYIVCDGGIFWSGNANAKFPNFKPLNKNLRITQFYGIAGSLHGAILGGTQDNGTQYINFFNNSKFDADELIGGDGGNAEMSKLRSGTMFAANPEEKFYRSSNHGQSFSTFFDERIDCEPLSSDGSCNGDDKLDGGGGFIIPFMLWEDFDAYVQSLFITPNDPVVKSRFFVGTGQGQGSGDLWVTDEPLVFSKTPKWYNIATASPSEITAIASSKDGNLIYAGTADGKLIRFNNFNTLDLNAIHNKVFKKVNPTGITEYKIFNLKDVAPAGSEGRYITAISISQSNPKEVVVSLGNYGNNDYVLRSTNSDASSPVFASIQGELPKMPVYDIVIDRSNSKKIILGNDRGVWAGEISGTTATWSWQSKQIGNTPVYSVKQETTLSDTKDIKFASASCYVTYAGTHGKGIYRSTSLTSSFCDVSMPTTIDGVENVPSTTANITLAPNPMSQAATLTITTPDERIEKIALYDVKGTFVQTLSNQLNPGNHQITINRKGLPAGNYLVVTSTPKGNITRQLIIQ